MDFRLLGKKYYLDLICLGLLLLTLPLFFYKLGQASLGSWDEAWYGVIARNMARSGDLLHMVVNGVPFSDHPLGGIWLMALFYKLFGVSELTTRLPSAIMGFGSLVVVYFLGQKLFNRVVGLSSALALCSSFWFLYRSRLGDLDIPLVFFFLLTLFLALLASEKRKYFLAFSISFGYLTTIKAALPFAVVPVLILIFWRSKLYKLKDYLLPILCCLLFYGAWLILIYIQDPKLVGWHFFHSGRNTSFFNNALHSFSIFKQYLHSGIGKWFWPGILGILGSLLLRQKRFLILSVFFFSYSLPFLTSPQVEIWHLIPLYPIMVLAFFGFSFVCGEKLFDFIHSRILKKAKFLKRNKKLIIAVPILLLVFYWSSLQFRQIWYQIVDISEGISAEAALSKKASEYPNQFQIDGDFIPVAAFYSDKEVKQYTRESVQPFFDDPKSGLMITHNWRLSKSQIPPSAYQVIQKNQDLVLLKKLIL